MNEIKVSVVMPCLNAKEYIGEAIASIRNQTLEEWELIVVDAGSDDGTEEMLEKFQKEDSRIIFLRSDKKSMGDQYNIGIRKAAGKYIGFVESDDYIHFGMYQSMYEAAEKWRLDFVKSDFDMFITDEEGPVFFNYSVLSSKRKEVYGKVIRPADYPELLCRDVNMWNGLYRREFLLENEVTLNNTAGAAFQDMGFVLKSFMSAYRIMYLNIPSYYYRKDNGNASVYNRSRHVRFVMDEFFFIRSYIKRKKIDDSFRAVVLKRFLGIFCSAYDFFRFHGESDPQIEGDVSDFLDYFTKCCQELNYAEVREEMLDISLSFGVMESVSDFESVRKYIDASERKVKRDFYQKVKDRTLIIFGIGEYGTALYAFLRRNHVKKVLCFCDNDKEKTGKLIMGVECLLPSQTVERFKNNLGDVLFLVANETHYQEMSRQLRQMGIARSHIIRGIGLLPHNAFEWNMEEC